MTTEIFITAIIPTAALIVDAVVTVFGNHFTQSAENKELRELLAESLVRNRELNTKVDELTSALAIYELRIQELEAMRPTPANWLGRVLNTLSTVKA